MFCVQITEKITMHKGCCKKINSKTSFLCIQHDIFRRSIFPDQRLSNAHTKNVLIRTPSCSKSFLTKVVIQRTCLLVARKRIATSAQNLSTTWGSTTKTTVNKSLFVTFVKNLLVIDIHLISTKLCIQMRKSSSVSCVHFPPNIAHISPHTSECMKEKFTGAILKGVNTGLLSLLC